jgi:hypothetical protein
MAPELRWRVAILDSGLDPAVALPIRESARFEVSETLVRREPALPDMLGHGTRVAQIIASAEPRPELLIAQVLDARGMASAAALAAAVAWAVSNGAQLLHMSLGLAQDRAVLREAVAAATGAGALLVASCPARGAMTYPARYDGVLSASGDARCQAGEISALGEGYAEFGGCVRIGSEERSRGASIGAAHVTRFIIAHARPGEPIAALRTRLATLAAYRGPERRQ